MIDMSHIMIYYDVIIWVMILPEELDYFQRQKWVIKVKNFELIHFVKKGNQPSMTHLLDAPEWLIINYDSFLIYDLYLDDLLKNDGIFSG